MSEWTAKELAAALNELSGTDTREKFYEACAKKLKALDLENRQLKMALTSATEYVRTHDPEEALKVLVQGLRDLPTED